MIVPSRFVEKAAAKTAIQTGPRVLDPLGPLDSTIKVGDTVLCSIDEEGHQRFEGVTGIVLREEMGHYIIQEHDSLKEVSKRSEAFKESLEAARKMM